ncbi:unnamed protein product [Closterium sp. NIES-53]
MNVDDPNTDQLSARTLRCVFLCFPFDALDFTFYHPSLHQFFDSLNVRIDEYMPFYARYPHRGLPIPPLPSSSFPLLLLVLLLPPHPGPTRSGVPHTTSPPLVARPVSLCHHSPYAIVTVAAVAFGATVAGVLALGGNGTGDAGVGGDASQGVAAEGAALDVLALGVLELAVLILGVLQLRLLPWLSSVLDKVPASAAAAATAAATATAVVAACEWSLDPWFPFPFSWLLAIFSWLRSHPLSDYFRLAHPIVSLLLSSLVIDPTASPSSVSALVAAITDFSSACRLDYGTWLVSAPPSRLVSPLSHPLSARGELALGCDILKDRHFELEFLAAAAPPRCHAASL